MTNYVTHNEVAALVERVARDYRLTRGEVAQFAADANAAAAAASSLQFASRADAIAATIPAPLRRIAVVRSGTLLEYARDAAGTALETSGGVRWSPLHPVRAEHFGAVGDGVTDDTAAFAAALAFGGTVTGIPGKRYLLGDLTITGTRRKLDLTGCQYTRRDGARHAVTVTGSMCELIGGQCYNPDLFNADNTVNPARVFASTISSIDAPNQLTVAAIGRAEVGMRVFFETTGVLATTTTPPLPPEEANYITAIAGNQLILAYPIDGAFVPGAKIVGDHALIKVTGFAAYVETTINTGVVGFQIGDHTGSPVGNTGLRLIPKGERVIGAVLVHTINSAAEVTSGFKLAGQQTVTATYTATAGQTTFPYAWNISRRVHRGGPEVTITATRNGTDAPIASIDDAAGSVSLSTPASAGDVVVVSNREYGARGLLFDGIGGGVSGTGLTGLGTGIGFSVALEVKGGPAGVEFGNFDQIVLDTISHTGYLIRGSRNMDFSGCAALFAPYPVVITEGASGHSFVGLSTSVPPSASIHRPAAYPNRQHVFIDASCSTIYLPDITRRPSGGNFTVVDPGNRRVSPPHLVDGLPAASVARGSFTARVSDASGNLSPTTVTGYWSRSGKNILVTFNSLANIDTTGLVQADFLRVPLPVPAVSASGYRWSGTSIWQGLVSTPSGWSGVVYPKVSAGASFAAFAFGVAATGAVLDMRVSHISSGVTDLNDFTLSYEVD